MKPQTATDYIYHLISQGEHRQQDFKFEISDARKIAKSLSAFSNTEGGRLLIGVKDNGKIAGVRSEEEIYMIDAAAKLYCKPQVPYRSNTYQVEGRTVVEIIIPEGRHKPYYAKDNDNRYKAYIRINDENILASPVHLRIWQLSQARKGTFIQYSEREQALLDYLSQNPEISLSAYCKRFSIPRFKAINILAKLAGFGLIEPFFNNRRFYYRLTPDNAGTLS